MLFHDKQLGRPLPIQDAIATDESGNGYALRMVNANSLMFCDLTKSAASIGHRYLPATAAGHIAYWFGADPVAVARAIPVSFKSRGRLLTRFMGHDFHRAYHIRLNRPQVCPSCLDEYGRAFAVWDISLVTSCPVHRNRLMDFCLDCGRRLSWRRPDLWTCQCKAEFHCPEGDEASADELWLSQHIGDLLYHCRGPSGRNASHREILTAFSLDVLVRVIRALGISSELTGKDIVPGRVTRILTTAEATTIISRAFSRLSGILQSERMAQADSLSLHLNELRDLHDNAEGPGVSRLHGLLNIVALSDRRFALLKSSSNQLNLFLEHGNNA